MAKTANKRDAEALAIEQCCEALAANRLVRSRWGRGYVLRALDKEEVNRVLAYLKTRFGTA